MKSLWSYCKSAWTWSRWTVQGMFVPDRNALPCGHYEGRKAPHHPKGQCPLERPGSDAQFEAWAKGMVMCDRCGDYFNPHDPDDDIMMMANGEMACAFCRKGLEE